MDGWMVEKEAPNEVWSLQYCQLGAWTSVYASGVAFGLAGYALVLISLTFKGLGDTKRLPYHAHR